MSAIPAAKFISMEEYLLLEEASDTKHEYYQGEVFAMAGGSIPHNQISRNTLGELYAFLKGRDCQAFPSDQRIHCPFNSFFTYPDISIVCGEIETLENRDDTITNPIVIIEVLSKSTQGYDRGEKFKLYRSIPSLKEYILLSSLEFAVEQFVKKETGFWTFKETVDPESIIAIETVGFSIPLKELYRDIVFGD